MLLNLSWGNGSSKKIMKWLHATVRRLKVQIPTLEVKIIWMLHLRQRIYIQVLLHITGNIEHKRESVVLDPKLNEELRKIGLN